ncbi:ATP-binding protein [uncultured Shewanella sp.]|uniref:ATP-binding protein n=1 Tax=uncultured Shewanella sp. TaxID=173975 RepID=UPI00262972E3|nr:ATP-binding protein [uncultured Shewanella sp.]
MLNNNVLNLEQINDEQSLVKSNIQDLENEMAWCEHIIDTRLKLHFKQDKDDLSVFELPTPARLTALSHFAQFVMKHALQVEARLILILALVPVLKPKMLDVLTCQNELTLRPFTEFACVEDKGYWYATGETVSFLLGGDDLSTRLKVQSILQTTEGSGLQEALALSVSHDFPVLLKVPLKLRPSYLEYFTTANEHRPELFDDFCATRMNSTLEWQDLVLPNSVMEPLEEIQFWANKGQALLNEWGLMHKLRPGFRALFYGPPGTGKTMAVSVLGKAISHCVYRVDLSKVISKYIGETETNLEQIFTLAESQNWILFFDEADALFGKRTQASGANDQFANQNVAYLLQRIECFSGLSVLATNFKDNLDDAFFRRFESVIYFPKPNANERLRLWRQGFSPLSTLEPAIDLELIAKEYSLSGAEIMNVIRFASLQALRTGGNEISHAALLEGIRRQKVQEGNKADVTVEPHLDLFG